MKKIICLIVILEWSLSSFSQVLISEGFEGAFPPSGWAFSSPTYYHWLQWFANPVETVHSGAKSAMIVVPEGPTRTGVHDHSWFTSGYRFERNERVRITYWVKMLTEAAVPPSINFQTVIATSQSTAAITNTIHSRMRWVKNTWYMETAEYTFLTAGIFYFGFRNQTASTSGYETSIALDDIVIEKIPYCNKPSLSRANYIDASRANFTIGNPTGATNISSIQYAKVKTSLFRLPLESEWINTPGIGLKEFSDLEIYDSYMISVRSVCPSGYSANASTIYSHNPPCSQPTVSVRPSSKSVSISFSVPYVYFDSVEYVITEGIVRSPLPPASASRMYPAAGPSTVTFSHNGLAPNREYYLKMRAKCRRNCTSTCNWATVSFRTLR